MRLVFSGFSALVWIRLRNPLGRLCSCSMFFHAHGEPAVATSFSSECVLRGEIVLRFEVQESKRRWSKPVLQTNTVCRGSWLLHSPFLLFAQNCADKRSVLFIFRGLFCAGDDNLGLHQIRIFEFTLNLLSQKSVRTVKFVEFRYIFIKIGTNTDYTMNFTQNIEKTSI